MVPVRHEEIIEPVRLGSEEFADRILEVGHSKPIGLFRYQRAKEPPSISEDALIIDQPASDDWRRELQAVRMQFHESGAMALDSNVTGRRERANSSDMMDIFGIAIEDVEGALASDFRFVDAVYEEIDPYKRRQRLFWNAALIGLATAVSRAIRSRSRRTR